MMPYETWRACIVEAARNIASREFQEQAWFPGGSATSSPDELYQALMEDCTFDLFFQMYGQGLTGEQLRSSKELRSLLEEYYDKIPTAPNPKRVLDDPEWNLVRQAAAGFVRAFSDG